VPRTHWARSLSGVQIIMRSTLDNQASLRFLYLDCGARQGQPNRRPLYNQDHV
jgi:hypothetical protein